VPLIVRWPEHVPLGKVVDAPVINTDWFPTLMELIDAQKPRKLDGQSFAAVLLGGESKERMFFWHFPHYTNQGSRPGGAMRWGDWKFIEHYDTGTPELYNLVRDPDEKVNLASRERERVTNMRHLLASWIAEIDGQTNAPNPDFNSARYRELYEDIDVSKFTPTKADAPMRARILAWRRQMNAALLKEK
jgi:arylsulfatase A-like enzyme